MAQLVRSDHQSASAVSSPPPSAAAAERQAAFADCSASMDAQPESSDGHNSNADHPKKPAWNKPLNGVVVVEDFRVMGGAVSWPALSDATKPTSKSRADYSSPSSDAPVSISQGPVISHSPHQKNQKKHANTTNSNPNFTPNHRMPVRQKSSKHGGGSRANNGFSRPQPPPPPLPRPLAPLPPPFPLFEVPYGPMLAAVPDTFIRETPYKGNNSWEGIPVGGFVSQSDPVNYHQSSHRNPKGNSNGSSRDQSRGWNAIPSSNARDVRVPQQMAPPRGFLRPPPPPVGSIPFITPHSSGYFGYPMGFDMTVPFWYVPTPFMESFNEPPFTAHAPPPPPPSMESFNEAPFTAHALPPAPSVESFNEVPFTAHTPTPPPPLGPPDLDDTLRTALVGQINFYFSDDNLVKDRFLRSNMDGEGWVPLSLIAGFPKVEVLTNNIQFIYDSLGASSLVEVQPYKVRRRDEWRKWLLPPESGSQPPSGSTYSTIISSLQKVTLDEATPKQTSILGEADSSTEVIPCRNSSEELIGHSKVANGERINEEACSSQL